MFLKLWTKKLLDKILNKQFLYSCMIVFLTGFTSRYIILVYLDVNVLTDIFNKVSISYYVLMSVYIPLVRAIISELYGPTMLLMEGDQVAGGAGGGNNPSGVGRGTGSGAGRGAGNPPVAGIGSSTGAAVDSSSHSTSDQESKDKAEQLKYYQEASEDTLHAIKKAIIAAYGTGKEGIGRVILEQDIWEKKKFYEREFMKSPRSPQHFEAMKIQQDYIDHYFRAKYEVELEAQRLKLASANSPYSKFWENNLESPDELLKLIDKSGRHTMGQVKIDNDEKTSICKTGSEVVDLRLYYHNIKISERVSKSLEYKNLETRIAEQLAVLDEIEKRNHDKSLKENLKTSRANLDLGKLLITDKIDEIQKDFKSEDCKKWAKFFSHEGNPYYKRGTQEQNPHYQHSTKEENTVNSPINHDNDVD
uniref:Uncharacterized protein n=1 Tax=Cladonia apodocarpa TaxID=195755 RepID=A0A385JEL7_CLAAP|nr:hypothetical protein [Cladonia apodocarpa]AXY96078.1 hypothetical protein [Cladonia apodocarpa]WBP63392.1 hypothetical protein [Cladonia apodocarpa]